MMAFGLWQYHVQRRKGLALGAEKKADHREERDRLFQYRQARRRQQIGLLTGIAGLAVFVGIGTLPHKEWITWSLLAWLLVLGCLCWTVLIALIDIMSIRLYYSRESRLDAEEAGRLQQEFQERLKTDLGKRSEG